MCVADMLLTSGHIVPCSLLYKQARQEKWVEDCFAVAEATTTWEWPLVTDLVHISQFSKSEYQTRAHELLEKWGVKQSIY